MSEPRSHHYVPTFHLAGFTKTGRQDDKLWIFQRGAKGPRYQRPTKVAKTRDYYRLNPGADDPFAIERALGEMETEAARVVARLVDTMAIPTGEDFGVLMSFVAFAALRVPRLRNAARSGIHQTYQNGLDSAVSSREHWDTVTDHLRRTARWQDLMATLRRDHGIESEDDLPGYDEMKAWVESGQYDFAIDRSLEIALTLLHAERVTDLLARRTWRLMSPATDTAEFICSDCPVSLAWLTPTPPWPSPGFAMRQTEVSIPLTRRLALVGRFEARGGGGGHIDERAVALLNHRAATWATECVYSASSTFLCLDQEVQDLRRRRLVPRPPRPI